MRIAKFTACDSQSLNSEITIERESENNELLKKIKTKFIILM